jgi:2-keto-3-deoxy-L-rhamnonate aldolase RhmA
VRAILDAVVAACQRHGKVAAIPCAPEHVQSYHEMGFRFFNVISDYRCVFQGMKAAHASLQFKT